MPRRPARYVVESVAQLRALSGPVPHQVISTLERLGAASVRELATAVGLPPESLYYHVRRLVAVGLLRVREERATRRRPEAVYELPARELVVRSHGAAPAFTDALVGLHRSLMQMAIRIYERALRRGDRPVRGLRIIQQSARLAPSDLAELERRLEEIAGFLVERDDPQRDRFVSLTISLAPVQRG